MFQNIPVDQLELLYQRLIVPIAVSDIMTYDLDVSPDMQYGLHMTLSELDPDSALLAIALCCTLLGSNTDGNSMASILKNNAKDIVEEYAPGWIYHEQHPPMSEEVLRQTMKHVPEDLESLADLLDAFCAEIEDRDSNRVIIANILSIQARAHMEIAEFVLEEMHRQSSNRSCGTDYQSSDTVVQLIQRSTTDEDKGGDNIILFPTHLT